jgi:hypothetical protein
VPAVHHGHVLMYLQHVASVLLLTGIPSGQLTPSTWVAAPTLRRSAWLAAMCGVCQKYQRSVSWSNTSWRMCVSRAVVGQALVCWFWVLLHTFHQPGHSCGGVRSDSLTTLQSCTGKMCSCDVLLLSGCARSHGPPPSPLGRPHGCTCCAQPLLQGVSGAKPWCCRYRRVCPPPPLLC